MSKLKLFLLIIFAATLVAGSAYYYFNFIQKRINFSFLGDNSVKTTAVIDAEQAPRLEVIAERLEVPWALAFLPDRSILLTERAGRVRFIDNKNNLKADPVAVIDDVLSQGEGGLMGIAVHPDFSANHFIYLYYTYANNDGETLNRVVRFKFEDNNLSDALAIADKIPGNIFHNGGRIKFGPDNFLYITTGDSQNPSLAQNKNSLAGKILRVKDDGGIPTDNPFGNAVWSMGHRNPQGITWDSNNRLWAAEHGPSALDELNVINKGGNYGWPTIRGNQMQTGMEAAYIHSGNDTWAPGATAYLNNSIFFAGLRGQTLYRAVIDKDTISLKEYLKGEVGRIREVVVGPDSLLYITTSNRDGRGVPDRDSDRIIRINPDKL